MLTIYAGVAELADALDLGSSAVRRAGSIPVSRTKQKEPIAMQLVLFVLFKSLPLAEDGGAQVVTGKQLSCFD